MSTPDAQAPELSPAQAHRLASSGEVLLLDVREPDEWQAGHAEGATHVPLGSLSPDKVPTDRLVVAVCRSGGRSGQAASMLAGAGVDVRNMAGGMNAWSAAQLPVVTDAGGQGTVI